MVIDEKDIVMMLEDKVSRDCEDNLGFSGHAAFFDFSSWVGSRYHGWIKYILEEIEDGREYVISGYLEKAGFFKK